MARFCPKKLYRVLKPAIELMAGIPSIVYGFFGLMVIVPTMQTLFWRQWKGHINRFCSAWNYDTADYNRYCGISHSRRSRKLLRRLFGSGSNTREKCVFCHTAAAKSGILAGIILGIGRAIGETMAVIIVAGNQAVIPRGILSGVRTMTSNIVLEMGYAAELHRDALIATSVVLFVFILIINLSFSFIKRREK
jgi:phosphate transport system permease protein